MRYSYFESLIFFRHLLSIIVPTKLVNFRVGVCARNEAVVMILSGLVIAMVKVRVRVTVRVRIRVRFRIGQGCKVWRFKGG